MNTKIKKQILDMSNYKDIDDNTKVATFEYQEKKLVVTHFKKRAKKDKFEREKGIEKVKVRLQKSSSAKSQLSNAGYKK